MATVVTGSEIHFLVPDGEKSFKARVLDSQNVDCDIVGKHFTVKRLGETKYELTIHDSTEHTGIQQAWAIKMFAKSSHADFSLPKDGSFNTWIGFFNAIIAPPGCNCEAKEETEKAHGFVGIGTADIADIGGDDQERVLQYRVRLNFDSNNDGLDEASTIQFAVWSQYPDVLLILSNTSHMKMEGMPDSTIYEMKLRSTKKMDMDFRNPLT